MTELEKHLIKKKETFKIKTHLACIFFIVDHLNGYYIIYMNT